MFLVMHMILGEVMMSVRSVNVSVAVHFRQDVDRGNI